MRASTSRWRATKRGWSAILRPLAGFKARCCRDCPGPEYGLDIAARVVSSRELSGDLYDFLRYGPQELAIALGDVSGKGSAAALYGAVGIGTLRSLAPQKHRPAEMLRAINGFLGERMIEGRFMTLCFATWHRGRRKLRVANAGQEQPFLFHGGRCEKIRLAGFPLGIFEEAIYDQRSFILDAGDVVVFHSDGIGDTQNPPANFSATTAFASSSRKTTNSRRMDSRTKFSRSSTVFPAELHPADDRTLVVLKVK